MQKNMILALCLSLMTSLAFAGAGALPTVRVEAIKKANEAAEKKAELDKLLEDSGALSKLKKAFADNKNNKEALEIAALQYLDIKARYAAVVYEDAKKPISIQRLYDTAEISYRDHYCQGIGKFESPERKTCNDNVDTLIKATGGLVTRGNLYKDIQIPKVDSKNGTYTINGVTYSVNPKENSQPATNTPPKDKKEFKAAESKTTQTAKSEDSTYECDWSDSFPRKILHGPGCKSEGTRICAGYVSCKSNGRQIDRLATCSDTLCGEGQATQCALQKGYGSMTANPVNGSAKSSADQNSNSGNNNQ